GLEREGQRLDLALLERGDALEQLDAALGHEHILDVSELGQADASRAQAQDACLHRGCLPRAIQLRAAARARVRAFRKLFRGRTNLEREIGQNRVQQNRILLSITCRIPQEAAIGASALALRNIDGERRTTIRKGRSASTE